MRTWIVVGGFTVFALSGCIKSSTPNAQPPSPSTPQYDALVARVSNLENTVSELSRKANRALIRISSLENRYVEAEFDPSEPTFQRIDSSTVSFAVSLVDVAPFGDGVKVTLNLGNLSSAAVSGVTLHISYGPRTPTDDKYLTWVDNLKKKDADITETLEPGSWNPTKVALPGIDSRTFGYLSVSIDAKSISLRKK
jgi:hypothetical protein